MGPVVQILGGAAKSIFVIIAILALAFFWVQEGEVLMRRILILLPADSPRPRPDLYGELEGNVSAFFRGQLILCGVVGLMSLIGYVASACPMRSASP